MRLSPSPGLFPFGALVVAMDGVYVGKVGTGFTDDERARLWDIMRARPDTEDFGRWKVPRDVHHEMILVCAPIPAEVKCQEMLPSGRLRHPVFVRLKANL